jgi:ArsR family transcriptional regulator
MPEIDLVRGEPPLEVEFRLSLGASLVYTMSLVGTAPLHEGCDQWVYATYSTLPPDLKAEMEVIQAVLEKSSGLDAWVLDLPADDPANYDFAEFSARLGSLADDDFGAAAATMLEEWSRGCQEETTQEVPLPSLDEPDALTAFLRTVQFDERHLEQAVHLLRHPAELKARFVAALIRFWNDFYREEYERYLPIMEHSVQHHRRQGYSGDFVRVSTAVVGRVLPIDQNVHARTRKVVFIPSCHTGPYVGVSHYLKDSRPVLILSYNCRLTGTPDRDQPLAVQELFPLLKALADETRLQILSILSGQELYIQEIVDQLDISQPAVSRHLKLMVTSGLLTVRKEDSMKYLAIDEEILSTLADRLRSFRGKG